MKVFSFVWWLPCHCLLYASGASNQTIKRLKKKPKTPFLNVQMTRRRINLIDLTTSDGQRCPNPVLEGPSRAGFSFQPGRKRFLRGTRALRWTRGRMVGQKTRPDRLSNRGLDLGALGRQMFTFHFPKPDRWQRWLDCSVNILISLLLWDQMLACLNNQDLTNQLRQDQAA